MKPEPSRVHGNSCLFILFEPRPSIIKPGRMGTSRRTELPVLLDDFSLVGSFSSTLLNAAQDAFSQLLSLIFHRYGAVKTSHMTILYMETVRSFPACHMSIY